MTDTISLLIIDDHALVRQGIRAFLELQPDLIVLGEADSGEAAVRMAAELVPDVALMDLVMPGIGGVEATRQLKQVSPHTQVIVLTSYHEDEYIFPALRAGALSYVLKDVGPDELADTVRKAARDESVLHPRVASRVVQELSRIGGLAPDRGWTFQCRYRRKAGHQRKDGQGACQQYLEQAAYDGSDAGGCLRLAARICCEARAVIMLLNGVYLVMWKSRSKKSTSQ